MASNLELTNKLALDMGLELINRRPSAEEVFKWLDIDLLPHSSVDTLLCELYEWSGRNWRTSSQNLIGEIFKGDELQKIKHDLNNIPKFEANIPNFEFTKDNLSEFGVGIPKLFNIGLKGDIDNAKEISIKINDVKKKRITNIDNPGIKILHKLSEFAQNNSKQYRKELKHNYISMALFYAESVEISLKKDADVDIELGFDIKDIGIKAEVDTETHKDFKITYNGKNAPFAADFVKIKEL